LHRLTGMRESEVLALKWEDFDTEAQIVRVRRSLYRGKLNAPKTERSERVIPYGDIVGEALDRLAKSDRKAPDFLFVTAPGNLFTAQEVTKRVFKPLARSLKIPAFTWRSFRRSAETALHTGGVPLKVQQQILGHSNPNMTLLYAESRHCGEAQGHGRTRHLIVANCCQIAKAVARSNAQLIDFNGWEAGIRTPIRRSRVCSPTVRRPPSGRTSSTTSLRIPVLSRRRTGYDSVVTQVRLVRLDSQNVHKTVKFLVAELSGFGLGGITLAATCPSLYRMC
jgi:Phage integrase family